MFKKQWLNIFFLIALCATLGFIDALKSYASAYHDQIHNLPWSVALRWNLIAWSVWIIFIPLISYLSSRFWINQRNWQRRLLLFIPLGLILSLIKVFFPFLISSFFANNLEFSVSILVVVFKATFSVVRWYFLFSDFFIAFVFYCLVLAFVQGKNYYLRYREEEVRSSQLESQLARAELNALKMQLHPHFLFNALNSISALQFEDAGAARKMISRLGDFLRMTLDNAGIQIVSLRREIEFLECYLEIERVRFEDRLVTNFRIKPETLDAQVPNLILQPLVENAVRHGISTSLSTGLIYVSAKRTDNGKLILEVSDSGNSQNKENKQIEKKTNYGIGLKNTRQRLKQLYGDEGELDLKYDSAGGVTVTLTLPLIYTQKGVADTGLIKTR